MFDDFFHEQAVKNVVCMCVCVSLFGHSMAMLWFCFCFYRPPFITPFFYIKLDPHHLIYQRFHYMMNSIHDKPISHSDQRNDNTTLGQGGGNLGWDGAFL